MIDIEAPDNVLTDFSKDEFIYKPDCITNHQFLRSFNANVCILPGQESTPVFPSVHMYHVYSSTLEIFFISMSWASFVNNLCSEYHGMICGSLKGRF